MRISLQLERGDDVLGDERTYVKKRTFWATRMSRTMSPDYKTASGSIQKSLDALMVDRSGYLTRLNNENTPESQTRLDNINELIRAMEAARDEEADADETPLERLQRFLERKLRDLGIEFAG